MTTPSTAASSTVGPHLGEDGCAIIATAHHLPPPTAGYTFVRHVRSTLSHSTFLAQRSDAEGSPADLCVVRVYALDYLKRREQQRNMVEREVLVGRTAQHRNIAEALPPFASTTDLFTVQRYYSGGELFDSVESYYRSIAAVARNGDVASCYGGLPLSIVRRIFREIMQAVHYLHTQMGLAHRNIKLENILLDEANSIRLSGLGLCAVITGDAEKQGATRLLKLCCGSKHYVAPELLNGQPYDGTAVDVWAAGVVLFCLVTGAFPFDSPEEEPANSSTSSGVGGGDDAIFAKIRNGEAVLEAHTAFNGLPDPHLQDLLRGILRVDPKVRLSVEEVLEHPFLSARA